MARPAEKTDAAACSAMGAGGASAAIAMKPTTMKKADVRIPLRERFPREDSPFVRTGIWRSAVLMEILGSWFLPMVEENGIAESLTNLQRPVQS
jgi:hypothetical protein